MTKFFKKAFFGLLFLIIFVPQFSSADIAQTYDQLYNPIPNNQLFCPTFACDLQEMFLLILRDILQIIPIASVLAIAYGGAQMIISSGNEERITRAKRTIFYAVVGLIVSLLSFSIIAIVKELLQANY